MSNELVPMAALSPLIRNGYHAALMEAFMASPLRDQFNDDLKFEDWVVSPAIFPEYFDPTETPDYASAGYRVLPINTYRSQLERGLCRAITEGYVEQETAEDVRRALGWAAVQSERPREAAVLPFVPRPRGSAERSTLAPVIPLHRDIS